MNFSPLSVVCQLNMGQSPESSTYNKCREGIPFFQGNADFGGRYPQERIWCSKPKKIAYEGDILISVRAPIGALNVADQRCCIGRGLASLHPSEHLDRDYLYYFLFSKEEYLKSKGTGSTFKAISKKQLEDLLIPLPSILEQKKRSNILNRLWSSTIKRREQLRKLDELVKCRFVEMFGTIAEPLYEKSTIGNECKLKSGTTFSADKTSSAGDFMYVKVSDMNLPSNDIYITTSSSYVSTKIARTTYIDKGAVVFPKRGGAIGTNKKRILFRDTCVDLNIMGVIPGKRMTTDFLYAYFLQIDLRSLSDGSAVPQLNNKDIAPLQVMVPPMEKQLSFASFVHQLDKSRFA